MTSFSSHSYGFRKAASKLRSISASGIDNVFSDVAFRVRIGMAGKFSSASYSGLNDVRLYVSSSEGLITISATGHSVTFIEFGTGTYFPGGSYALKYGFLRGTFGSHHGLNPPWFYYGSPGGDSFPTGITGVGGSEQYLTNGTPALRAFEYGTTRFRSLIFSRLQSYFNSFL